MEQIGVFEITNELGLHARAAAKLVHVAAGFKSRIHFEKDGIKASGRDILDILTLECPKGSRLTVRARGSDAREAVAALGRLIENNFEEEQ